MAQTAHLNDSVHWHVSELTSRIVAESGIHTDRFHLGKIILQSFKDDPDFIAQIDGATGESETFGSVLTRTVQCANALRSSGFKKGDLMILMAPHHLDLAIPFYAALYLGIIISPIDKTLGISELQQTFSVEAPKIIFCQSEKVPDIEEALENLGFNAKIITFDKAIQACSLSEFLDKYGNDVTVEDFKPTEFNSENTIAILITTSGTTGLPKAAAASHKNVAVAGPYLWARYTKFPTPTRMALLVAPLQWLSAVANYFAGPYIKYTRLQSSQPITEEHAYYLINTYRPTYMIISPTMMTTLVKPGHRDRCDFTCFETILVGGSAVHKELIEEIKKLSPHTELFDIYGMSETNMLVFQDHLPTPGSCGKQYGLYQYRLVDVETGKDIKEYDVAGELWLKGPGIFLGYHNDPKATKEAFEDGWLKTGDMFYRDQNWNFYFVERIKLLLKYRNHQVSPVELEAVVRQHPGVQDVAVTGVPEPECGELPVACVVPRPGCTITAQEIKDLVKEKLTDSKQLRGGVIFLKELPTTSTTKIHRRKLKEMVLKMERL